MPKERSLRAPALQLEKDTRNSPYPVMCKEGKGMRNFSCTHYDNCLDKAAKGMWSGFTCKECGINCQKEDEKG